MWYIYFALPFGYVKLNVDSFPSENIFLHMLIKFLLTREMDTEFRSKMLNFKSGTYSPSGELSAFRVVIQ
jgi:hypothetical protein